MKQDANTGLWVPLDTPEPPPPPKFPPRFDVPEDTKHPLYMPGLSTALGERPFYWYEHHKVPKTIAGR